MSIEARRQSALKSSLSIKTIQSSVTSFGEGLKKSQKSAANIVSQTEESNKFKRTLIRKDGDFFARRRENVKRRQREDELEASSSGGILKQTGSLVARSTRGFLGRILDFFAISLLGFFTLQLPNILTKFEFLFKLIGKTLQVLRFFTDGIADFLVSFQEGIFGVIDKIRGVDIKEDDRKVKQELDKTTNSLQVVNQELFLAGVRFTKTVDKEAGQNVPVLTEFDNLEQDQKGDENNKQDENNIEKDSNKQNQELEKFTATDANLNLSPGDDDNENVEDETELITPTPNNLGGDNLTRQQPDGMTGASENDEDERESQGFLSNLNKFVKNFLGKKGEKESAGKENVDKISSSIAKEKEILKAKADENRNTLLESLKGNQNKSVSNEMSTENMFDGFGSSSLDLIDVDGLKKFSETNIQTDRPSTTILINNMSEGGNNSKSISSGGVNSSNLSSMFMMNKDDKTMDQIQSIILNI